MRALVVDDEPRVLKELELAMRDAPESAGGPYEVTAAGSDVEATEILQDRSLGRFDVVITDMVMGEDRREGLDVVKKGVLDETCNKSTVTIVVTAYPKFPDCVKAMRFGAWDFLEKEPEDDSDFYENIYKSLEEAWRYRRDNPEAGRGTGDSQWAREEYDKSLKDYAGEYVAVLDQQVVDHDADIKTLVMRTREKYPMAKPTIVPIEAVEEGDCI